VQLLSASPARDDTAAACRAAEARLAQWDRAAIKPPLAEATGTAAGQAREGAQGQGGEATVERMSGGHILNSVSPSADAATSVHSLKASAISVFPSSASRARFCERQAMLLLACAHGWAADTGGGFASSADIGGGAVSPADTGGGDDTEGGTRGAASLLASVERRLWRLAQVGEMEGRSDSSAEDDTKLVGAACAAGAQASASAGCACAAGQAEAGTGAKNGQPGANVGGDEAREEGGAAGEAVAADLHASLSEVEAALVQLFEWSNVGATYRGGSGDKGSGGGSGEKESEGESGGSGEVRSGAGGSGADQPTGMANGEGGADAAKGGTSRSSSNPVSLPLSLLPWPKPVSALLYETILEASLLLQLAPPAPQSPASPLSPPTPPITLSPPRSHLSPALAALRRGLRVSAPEHALASLACRQRLFEALLAPPAGISSSPSGIGASPSGTATSPVSIAAPPTGITGSSAGPLWNDAANRLRLRRLSPSDARHALAGLLASLPAVAVAARREVDIACAMESPPPNPTAAPPGGSTEPVGGTSAASSPTVPPIPVGSPSDRARLSAHAARQLQQTGAKALGLLSDYRANFGEVGAIPGVGGAISGGAGAIPGRGGAVSDEGMPISGTIRGGVLARPPLPLHSVAHAAELMVACLPRPPPPSGLHNPLHTSRPAPTTLSQTGVPPGGIPTTPPNPKEEASETKEASAEETEAAMRTRAADALRSAVGRSMKALFGRAVSSIEAACNGGGSADTEGGGADTAGGGASTAGGGADTAGGGARAGSAGGASVAVAPGGSGDAQDWLRLVLLAMTRELESETKHSSQLLPWLPAATAEAAAALWRCTQPLLQATLLATPALTPTALAMLDALRGMRSRLSMMGVSVSMGLQPIFGTWLSHAAERWRSAAAATAAAGIARAAQAANDPGSNFDRYHTGGGGTPVHNTGHNIGNGSANRDGEDPSTPGGRARAAWAGLLAPMLDRLRRDSRMLTQVSRNPPPPWMLAPAPYTTHRLCGPPRRYSDAHPSGVLTPTPPVFRCPASDILKPAAAPDAGARSCRLPSDILMPPSGIPMPPLRYFDAPPPVF
jgi:hypothetical protein